MYVLYYSTGKHRVYCPGIGKSTNAWSAVSVSTPYSVNVLASTPYRVSLQYAEKSHVPVSGQLSESSMFILEFI